MLNYIEIIHKLKDILSQEQGEEVKDIDVANALKIDQNNFRKQKGRNSPHYPEIMEFLAKRNISINWFFFNQLPESLIDTTSNYIILKYQKSIITSAGGGAINDALDSIPLVIDKHILDHINSNYAYTEVLEVFGDSMEPVVKDGSLVFVDKSISFIDDKSIYIINTEDGLHIKSIYIKGNLYYMRSLNTLYEDVKIDKFQVVGKVRGVFMKL